MAPHQIIGTSNALLQEALDSEAETADYVAVGSIFPTTTKEDTRPAGLETLSEVKRSVETPVVAIGGINHDNASRVAAGRRGRHLCRHGGNDGRRSGARYPNALKRVCRRVGPA